MKLTWIILFVIVYVIYLSYIVSTIVYKHFIVKELDLSKRYGKSTWVMITGADSGQGKRYAIEFAKRGFNIILSGYSSCNLVAKHIKNKYHVKTHVIECDFSNAWKDDFFVEFENAFRKYDISILVNNVAYRSGWKLYENMPIKDIRDTIAVGTIVQSVLTKLALKNFRKRNEIGLYKSAIINITTQLTHTPLLPFKNNVYTLPYLSVYSSSNAFGFVHSNSIQSEYGETVDILNITPGAVLTENTKCLENTPGIITSKQFVRNCMKLLGNVNGPTCGYWLHEVFELFTFLIPPKMYTSSTELIAYEFMKKRI